MHEDIKKNFVFLRGKNLNGKTNDKHNHKRSDP
jgi:hypothetical protein